MKAPTAQRKRAYGRMRSRLSRWLGVEDGKADTFLLDPDDPKSHAGERLIILGLTCLGSSDQLITEKPPLQVGGSSW
jgi:hypothetical protein